MGKKTLGRYEIQNELGRGSMGVVYRAHDPNLNRAVALKTILIPESFSEAERQTFLDRFRRESRAAARLIHPNVVIIHDASMDEGTGSHHP